MSPEEPNPDVLAAEEDPQVSKDKLFTFKDIEGKEQFEVIEKIGKFLDFIKIKDPRIVGISIMGSTVKGYAYPNLSTENDKASDVDIIYIYSDPNEIRESELFWKEWKGIEKLEPFIDEFNRSNNIEITPLRKATNLACFNNQNSVDDSELVNNPAWKIGALVFPYFGDVNQMNVAIETVRERIAKIDEPYKGKWVERFASGFQNGRLDNSDKAWERLYSGREDLPNFKTLEDYKQERIKMFRDRIRKLFID